MNAKVKKLITFSSEGIFLWEECKKATQLTDEKQQDVMVSLFATSIGVKTERAKSNLFAALVREAEAQQSLAQMMIQKARLETGVGPRQSKATRTAAKIGRKSI